MFISVARLPSRRGCPSPSRLSQPSLSSPSAPPPPRYPLSASSRPLSSPPFPSPRWASFSTPSQSPGATPASTGSPVPPNTAPRAPSGEDIEWVNHESPFKGQSDELNRKRHFFYHIDGKGRIWRKELADSERLYGEIQQDSFRAIFFNTLSVNDTGFYEESYPFVSRRGLGEMYFVSCHSSPIVFWDLQKDRLMFGPAHSTQFDPSKLHLNEVDGRLYHSIVIPYMFNDGAPPSTKRRTNSTKSRRSLPRLDHTILGLIETNLNYQLLESVSEGEGGSWSIAWEGVTYPITVMKVDIPTDKTPDFNPSHVQHRTAWWKQVDE